MVRINTKKDAGTGKVSKDKMITWLQKLHNSETKFIHFFTKRMYLFIALVCLLISVVMRFLLRGFLSGDMRVYLGPWYETLVNSGVKDLLNFENFNYNFMFVPILKIASLLPFSYITNLKLVTTVFDYICAIAVAGLVYHLTVHQNMKARNACLGFSFYCISPLVILNSGAWGQCDVIFSLFILLSIAALFKKRNVLSFILLGISFVFKLQAAFILPLYVIYYIINRRYSILHFLLIPLTLFVSGLPLVLYGKGILSTFTVYKEQAGMTFTKLTQNYPNFYTGLDVSQINISYDIISKVLVLFTLVVLMFLLAYIIQRRMILTERGMVYLGAFVILLCTFVLPAMHERYAFTAEILLIICLILKPNFRIIIATALVYTANLNAYMNYLLKFSTFPDLVAAIFNFAALVLLFAELFRKEENDYFILRSDRQTNFEHIT